LILVIAVSIVAYPVFRSPVAPSQAIADSPDEGLDELLVRRDATYATLKELDLDLEMGKLSETDHRTLRDRYRAEAVGILQEVDARQAATQPQTVKEGEPEQETTVREIEQDIAARRQRRRARARCPGCEATVELGERFCRHCGATLAKEGV
jgi:hypothetical protein